MQINPLLIHRPQEKHGEIKRRSSEQRRINSGIATGCASTKGRRGEILERRRRREVKNWRRNRTSLDEIVLLRAT